MFNYSENGMYFESNIPFKQGATIIFGIENSPFENCPGVYRATVKWCKKLPDKSSIYYYGIGVEFFKPNRLSFKSRHKLFTKKRPPSNSRLHSQGAIQNSGIIKAAPSAGSRQHVRSKGQYSRKHPRKPVSKNIHYGAHKQFFEGLIKDISRGGLFIKSNDKFPVGQELTLAIPSASRMKSFKLKGEVVRIDQEGFGVKFKNILKS
jgi:Tfp pilus assembly protein PilZ